MRFELAKEDFRKYPAEIPSAGLFEDSDLGRLSKALRRVYGVPSKLEQVRNLLALTQKAAKDLPDDWVVQISGDDFVLAYHTAHGKRHALPKGVKDYIFRWDGKINMKYQNPCIDFVLGRDNHAYFVNKKAINIIKKHIAFLEKDIAKTASGAMGPIKFKEDIQVELKYELKSIKKPELFFSEYQDIFDAHPLEAVEKFKTEFLDYFQERMNRKEAKRIELLNRHAEIVRELELLD